MKDLLIEFWKDLNQTFRFILPGCSILIICFLSHPDWFHWVIWGNKYHLAILIIISLVVGNVWYVFHRFIVLELINYIMFRCKCGYYKEKPFNRIQKYKVAHGYFGLLRQLADNWFPKMGNHLHFRNGHSQFAFIVFEAVLVFAIYPEERSFLARHEVVAIVIGLSGILGAISYHLLTAHEESQFVKKYQRNNYR